MGATRLRRLLVLPGLLVLLMLALLWPAVGGVQHLPVVFRPGSYAGRIAAADPTSDGARTLVAAMNPYSMHRAGPWLHYFGAGDTHWQALDMTTGRRHELPLTPDFFAMRHAPDGEWGVWSNVVFTSVVRMDADGSDLLYITPTGSLIFDALITPDASWILFQTQTDYNWYRIRAEGTGMALLGKMQIRCWLDAHRALIYVDASPLIVDLNGPTRAALVAPGPDLTDLRCLPNTGLVLGRHSTNSFVLFDPGTGDEVATLEGDMAVGGVMAAGQHVYYARRHEDRLEVRRRDLQTGADEPLVTSLSAATDWMWSLDGDHMLFIGEEWQYVALDGGGGMVLQALPGRQPVGRRWSPDDEWLYYVNDDDLARINLETGKGDIVRRDVELLGFLELGRRQWRPAALTLGAVLLVLVGVLGRRRT